VRDASRTSAAQNLSTSVVAACWPADASRQWVSPHARCGRGLVAVESEKQGRRPSAASGPAGARAHKQSHHHPQNPSP